MAMQYCGINFITGIEDDEIIRNILNNINLDSFNTEELKYKYPLFYRQIMNIKTIKKDVEYHRFMVSINTYFSDFFNVFNNLMSRKSVQTISCNGKDYYFCNIKTSNNMTIIVDWDKEKYKNILNFLHHHGYIWNTGDSLNNKIILKAIEEDTKDSKDICLILNTDNRVQFGRYAYVSARYEDIYDYKKMILMDY